MHELRWGGFAIRGDRYGGQCTACVGQRLDAKMRMNLYQGFMNAARRAWRPGSVSRGGRGAQFHPRRGKARHLAIGIEPHGSTPGNAARLATADAQYA